MIIEKVDFEIVLPVWQKLWPDSTIKSYSATTFGDPDYEDPAIREAIESGRVKPVFLAGFIDNEIVAVSSGFPTAPQLFRIRGLYVEPEHRNKGHGKSILEATCIEATKAKCGYAWAMPTRGAEHAYKKLGFVQVGGWFDDPNADSFCFVFRILGR